MSCTCASIQDESAARDTFEIERGFGRTCHRERNARLVDGLDKPLGLLRLNAGRANGNRGDRNRELHNHDNADRTIPPHGRPPRAGCRGLPRQLDQHTFGSASYASRGMVAFRARTESTCTSSSNFWL